MAMPSHGKWVALAASRRKHRAVPDARADFVSVALCAQDLPVVDDDGGSGHALEEAIGVGGGNLDDVVLRDDCRN